MQSTELSIQEMERCKLETDIVGFEIGKTASTERIILHCIYAMLQIESSVKP